MRKKVMSFEDMIKSMYQDGTLVNLLTCDKKYIFDEHHKYKYATDATKNNMQEDEIDPISFPRIVDGIKMTLVSLKSNKYEKSKFESEIVKIIKDMANSGDVNYIYYATKIVEIMYIQKLQDSTPQYNLLNGILNETLDSVRKSISKNTEALKNAHIYNGKYRKEGVWEYIREILDAEIIAFEGETFIEKNR